MQIKRILAVVILFGLTACGGGDYSGGSAGGSDNDSAGTSSSFASSEAFFGARISPQMDYCRTCHVPGGVADTEEGKRFLLSSNSAEDYSNSFAAWQALGEGVHGNMLIVENSDNSEPHSGGKTWPEGSDAYNDMVTLLTCWDDPANCVLSAAGGDIELLPLLGSSRATHPWESFCETAADDAALPIDPRTLIVPGVNPDRAVFFNSYFEECHDALPEKDQAPKTCGEYKVSRQRGEDLFLGRTSEGSISAEEHANSWQAWGYEERPENFDQLYTLRYGANVAPFDNPYPLPGEDPNLTGGGSGQLPLGRYQTKDESGNWTGMIASVSCFGCHGGQIGDPHEGEEGVLEFPNLGLGNNNADSIMSANDGSDLPVSFGLDTVFNIGVKQRGQNNAVGAFEVLFALLDYDSLGLSGNLNKAMLEQGHDFDHPTGVAQDTPAWWNYSHRSRKFFDAGQSIDSQRIVLAAHPNAELISADGKAYREAIENDDHDAANFITSRVSPEYPRDIDLELAKQGAVLFHAKDLWAEEGNADAPKPLGGNGSCASCHGAYAPRYVNDPSYLETPILEGVAAHISPLEVIGTDTARADTLSPYLRDAYSTTFWAYPDGAEGWVSPDDKDPVTELLDDALPNRPEGVCGWERGVIGYQAPPLYGTWATAPYFHNGSVPTLEAVLDSSKRPNIWQRKLQTIGSVTGFDQRMSVAFDWEAVGWKHDELSCDEMPGDSNMNCNPVNSDDPSMLQVIEELFYSNFNWSGLLNIANSSPEGVDKRLIYDTRILGNSEEGHTFTDVLTEAERRAIIEYLKTL